MPTTTRNASVHSPFLAIGLLICSVFGFAQRPASVAGTVTDPDNSAVPGASVSLYSRESDARISTQTDLDGRYKFTGVASGAYLLQVAADGFAGLTTEELTLAAGEARTRDVTLELAGLRTEVLVTASSTALMLEEISKAADTVTLEDINLRNEYSVAESLRLIPGFRVSQRQGPGSFTSIHVRGLRTHDTALLVDGLRMRDPSDPQGSVNPLWQDLMVVAPGRVETLRGSGSSLYGSHAIGGVVNLVSDQGGGQPHGELLGEGGGLGLARGLGKVSGGALGNRLFYSGGGTHLNVTNGLDDVNPYRNSSAQGFLKYYFTPEISLGGRLFLADAFGRLSDSPSVPEELTGNVPTSGLVQGIPLPDSQVRRIEQGLDFIPGSATYVPSLNDPDYSRSNRFSNVAATFAHQVGPRLTYRASYQLVDTERHFDDGPGGQRFEPLYNSHSRFDGRMDLLQARADFQAGAHNLISGGYEYESEEFGNANRDENPDEVGRIGDASSSSQSSHSVFLQDQIGLLNRNLQIALSGRMQAFRLEDPKFIGGDSPYEGILVESPKTAWTGDAAVSYLFRSMGAKWRAHVGNAYRAPSAFERYGASFFFGSFSPFGDPRLRPERALSVDTGIDQWLAGSKVRLSATYFYTRLQEVITFDFSGLIPPDDPFGRFGGYINLPGGLARGVELSANVEPARGSVIRASYTYANSDQRAPWDVEGLYSRSIGISENTFTLLVSQWIGRRVNFTFDMFAVDGYPFSFFTNSGTRAYALSGFVKADLTGRYVLPVSDKHHLEFFGKVENVFNQQPYEDGYRASGTWATGGVRFTF